MITEIIFTRDKIDLQPFALPSREIGAVVEFLGIVRGTENGASIAGLNYEAYETMAFRRLNEHCMELAKMHPCVSLIFTHRLGFVPVGEPSLLVRVFAKHRGPALALCEGLIDRMKEDVPIWKR